VVLVGDSGEHDPEIYGAIARAHPTQVRGILIRDVTGEGRGAPRYGKAFAGIPVEQWLILAVEDMESMGGFEATEFISSRIQGLMKPSAPGSQEGSGR
jgi:phosphatidate phosphatase APP1